MALARSTGVKDTLYLQNETSQDSPSRVAQQLSKAPDIMDQILDASSPQSLLELRGEPHNMIGRNHGVMCAPNGMHPWLSPGEVLPPA